MSNQQTRTLFPFQVDGIHMIDKMNGRCLLADSPGIGKTLQSIYWTGWRQKYPCLVICPSSLKINWKRECHLTIPGTKVQILQGKKPYAIDKEAHFVIINYDIVDSWMQTILNHGFECALVDEHHYIKNHNTKRSKAVMHIGKKMKHYIAITGTPVLSKPIEVWTALNILQPAKWGNWFSFAYTYCGAHQTRFGLDVKGASNVKKLNEELKSVMIRRLKQDVLPDLPKKIRGVVPFEIDNKLEYENAENGFKDWIKGRNASNRMDGLAKIEYARQAAVKGKTAAAIEWIGNFLESGEKLVLFGVHKTILQDIHAKFPNSVLVNGETSMKARQQYVDSFQNNPKTQLFIGNIQAAGVGLTLTASSNVAFLELPWRPGDVTQAEDRCNRIGTINCTNVHFLLADKTIEHKMYQLLINKQKIVDKVVDGVDSNMDWGMYNELINYYK